ncbi:MAG TPA: cytochrome P450 [Actinospica sp.]|jgi:cytochrome P450|nr:cytochrome P450 [Actinospica sp.]
MPQGSEASETAVTGAGAPAVCPFPLPRQYPLDPPPEFARLREQAPAVPVRMWDGGRAWLITRHAEARAVLSDTRFSSDVTRPGFPTYYEGQRVVIAEAPSFIRADPPEHSRLRRMLTPEFMLRRVEAMRPAVHETVARLIADIKQGPDPVDLVRALALPLPSITVGRMLGIPEDEYEIFQKLTAVNLSRDSTPEETEAATGDLLAWLDALISAKERHPGDDLLGRLVAEQVAPGLLSHDDLVAMARLLIVAGHETTANMLGLTLLSYLRHPEHFAGIADDPQLLDGVVEELLRYHSIIQIGLARVAIEDVEVGGVLIRSGEGVVVSLLAANRDPRTYENPDEFVVARPGAPRHVAFGFGVHQCIGQALARLEMRELLLGVVRDLPRMSLLHPVEEIPFRGEMTVHGVHELWARR